jgi:hypothetical protein
VYDECAYTHPKVGFAIEHSTLSLRRGLDGVGSHRHTLANDVVGTHLGTHIQTLDLGCYKGVTRVLQGCYKGVTRVLQGCYKGVTSVSQGRYKNVTKVLQGCYKGVTRAFQRCYRVRGARGPGEFALLLQPVSVCVIVCGPCQGVCLWV